MARKVDPASHAVRRDQFLDAAASLLQTKGFEQASIQDVLVETGASKGAFYHYFDSKQDLLEALAERMADTVAHDLRQAADISGMSALDRLNHLFEALGVTKLQHRDAIVGLLRAWFSDANAAVRQRLRAGIADRIAPIIREIMDQGTREGTFSVEPGFERVVALMVQDHNDELGQRFLQFETLGESLDVLMADANRTIAAYAVAIERILGCAPGSIRLVDTDVLRAWFRP